MLEAAFVAPVFFALVLGVIELGLAMSDYLGVSNAARAGARVASASGSDLYSDFGIIKSVARESTAINRAQINRIVIYKANAFGDKPTAACQAGTASSGSGPSRTGACNVYTAAALSAPKADFGCIIGKKLDEYWCPTIRKVTESTTSAGAGTDYVGVWMSINHPWVTKMFGNNKVLTESSVIRLEPRAKT